MNDAFQDALYFLGVSLSYIVAFLLIRSPVGHKTTNRLLGISFFCMGWFNMVYLLTLTGLFTKVYWLAGWGPPLAFLISPCAYLYVRQSLNNKSRLERRDWIHFIPFFISFLDLLPFNLGWYMDKQTYIHHAVSDYNQFFQQRVSLIPLRVHFVLRPILALGYLFFQWRMLLLVRTRSGRIYRWLIIMTALQTFFYVMLTLLSFLGLATHEGMYIARHYQPLMILLYFSFFLISVILMFYPDALYGIPPVESALGATPEPSLGNAADETRFSDIFAEPGTMHAGGLEAILAMEEAPTTSEEKNSPGLRPVNEKIIAQYLPVIEAYIQSAQPYLQAKMSIQDMAVATRIPLHHLSYIINQHYKVRYTDLMNQYRVEHAKALIAKGAWKELSLEGLGKQSGFANRTNFFLVFKKSTGLSPSDYLQGVKAGIVTRRNG